MADVLIGLTYVLPIAWAIAVVARLGDIRKLLGKISEDIAALKKAASDQSLPRS